MPAGHNYTRSHPTMPPLNPPFAELDPDTVLTAVEGATHRRLLNICRPHSSYINRVYELQDENGEYLIAKFYRPQRWSRRALQDELDFVLDCRAAELPVIAPLELHDGGYLGSVRGICFALYPRCGGRVLDEYGEAHWPELGRLLGRVHQAGKARPSPARNRLHPLHTTREQLAYIVSHDLVPADLVASFSTAVEKIIAEIAPLFADVELQRIHGDCHAANLIYRPGESFYIIDFDDMVVGPPVQDLWMLLPGTVDDSRYELDLLLEGYETFSHFDRRTLKLIEPLRAMRFVHYISWCGRQFVEDGGARVNESFGSHRYWQQEIADLEDQLGIIRAGRPD